MKAWNWLKSLPVWATIGMIGAAVLMVLAGARASNQEKKAKRAEDAATSLAHDRTKKGIEKAAKLQEKSEAHKAKAAKAKKAAQDHIERVGKSNETLDDIADRFNSRRLRKQPASPDT